MIKRNVTHKRNCATCRSSRTKLYLKGQKCFTNCIIDKNKKTLGVAPIKDFGKLVQNKHNILAMYGLTSHELKEYVINFIYNKKYDHIFSILEMRLDSLIFRCGLAKSMPHARQIINHGKISVMDGKSPAFASLLLNINQTFSLKKPTQDIIIKNCEWLQFDPEKKIFKLISIPETTNCIFDNQLLKDYYKKH